MSYSNGYGVPYVTRSGLTRRISQPVYNSASVNSLLNISFSVSQGYIANTSFSVTAIQTVASLLSGSLPDGVYAIKQSASNPG